MPRRIPFDAAWGFDSHDELHTERGTDGSFHVIEGDALSLHYDGDHHHHDRRLFDPLPLDMRPAFEVLRPDDTMSDDDMGDNVSTISGATGLHSHAMWSVPPHITSRCSETERRGSEAEFHEITSTSSHSAEIIQEVDPSSFGPRGTKAMMTLMRRSEETRLEIIENLRSLPIDSVVALDTNIKHFFKTKDSRERLMSCFERGTCKHGKVDDKKRSRDIYVSQSGSDL